MRITLLSMLAASALGAQQPLPVRPVKVLFNIGERPSSREEVLAGITSVGVVKDKLYVLEGRGCTVKVFDAAGKFARRFGAVGEGPGECTRPTSLAVDDSTVTIRDFAAPPKQSRNIVFSLDGKHLHSAPIVPDSGNAAQTMRGGARFSVARTLTAASSASSPMNTDPPMVFGLLQPAPAAKADTIFRYRYDYAYVSRPGAAGSLFSGFGHGGAYAVSGDSMVAFVDGYEGVVKWFAITATGAATARTESLGKTGAPVTPEDVAARVQGMLRTYAPRGTAGAPGTPLPAGSVTMLNPPPRWSVATNAQFSSDGSLWISDRLTRPLPKPTDPPPGTLVTTTYRYTVYPPSGAPFVVELPSTFALMTIVGDKIYGYSIVGTGTVPVYQLSAR